MVITVINEIAPILPIMACAGAFIALAILTLIDLKVRLLPNTYVLAFALFGLAFHASTQFHFTSVEEMIGGMVIGGGLLYSVRFLANRIYNQDALGLGDVKLMMAGGLWLGSADILMAVIVGACAGIVHGLGMAWTQRIKTGKTVDLSRFALPAGPGFIFGLIAVAIYRFHPFSEIFLP